MNVITTQSVSFWTMETSTFAYFCIKTMIISNKKPMMQSLGSTLQIDEVRQATHVAVFGAISARVDTFCQGFQSFAGLLACKDH